MNEKQNIILAGAGSLARVIYDFAGSYFNIISCVDDVFPKNQLFEDSICVNRIEDVSESEFKYVGFLLAILAPKGRLSIVNRIVENQGRFVTYIHDTSFISPSAKIGKGCTLLPHSFIMNKAVLGDYVHIHFNTAIGHDVTVGDYSSFAPSCVLGGYCRIGKGVTCGMGVKILPNISVGDFAVIGAGAVVTRDIPTGALVVGNPAKEIKIREK